MMYANWTFYDVSVSFQKRSYSSSTPAVCDTFKDTQHNTPPRLGKCVFQRSVVMCELGLDPVVSVSAPAPAEGKIKSASSALLLTAVKVPD